MSKGKEGKETQLLKVPLLQTPPKSLQLLLQRKFVFHHTVLQHGKLENIGAEPGCPLQNYPEQILYYSEYLSKWWGSKMKINGKDWEGSSVVLFGSDSVISYTAFLIESYNKKKL